MPAESGTSHAMAAFVSIVIGAFISDFLAAHVEVLTAASERIGGATTESTGAVVPEEVAGLSPFRRPLRFRGASRTTTSTGAPRPGQRIIRLMTNAQVASRRWSSARVRSTRR